TTAASINAATKEFIRFIRLLLSPGWELFASSIHMNRRTHSAVRDYRTNGIVDRGAQVGQGETGAAHGHMRGHAPRAVGIFLAAVSSLQSKGEASMHRKCFLVTPAALVTLVFSVSDARAQGSLPAARDAEQKLREMERTAVAMKTDADRFASLRADLQISPELHGIRLTALKEAINRM